MRLSVTTRRIILGLIALLFVGLTLLWIERTSIARRFADAELRARQVNAQYRITAVGPRTQRIEDVVIGDPRNPDLVVKWAEIELTGGLRGVSIAAIRARGVRIRGRLVDNRVTFGAVDRLLPARTGEPFSLPDIDIALTDTRLNLETPMGALLFNLGGKGNVADGFAGRVAAYASRLSNGDVVASNVRAELDVRTADRRLIATGPFALERLGGAGVSLAGVAGRIATETDQTLALPRGNFQLAGDVDRMPYATATRLVADGRFGRAEGEALTLAATVRLAGLKPDAATRRALTGVVPDAAGTPVAPLVQKLGSAIAALDRGSNATAEIALLWGNQNSRTLRITPEIRSASGAWLRSTGEGIGWDFRSGTLAVNERLALSGGGFPDLQIQLASTGRGFGGQAIVGPYGAGNARLSVTPFRFAWSASGLRLDTVATLDGPLAGGRIEGLRIPLAIRPGASPLQGCIAPSFRTLEIQGLRLAPATLQTCIVGNEARIAAPRLKGQLGGSPISLSARSARVDFGRGDFTLADVAVRLGPGPQPTRLDATSLAGRFADGGATGRFAGMSGQIGAVPLIASNASGNWAFRNAILDVTGGMRIADAAAEPRFFPLVTSDFALRLAKGQIRATATGREPTTGTAITRVTIAHDLARGTGSAILDVEALAFNDRLQPEMITPITLGVIANVRGIVDGQGIIRWTPDAVTSSGGFRTGNIDLAAAFGPVTGLKGEIALSDLLNPQTGVPQKISIASINPGIAVVNGDIEYRLLPGLKAQIDGGRWPFAGGTLILEPTVLDLSASAERRLTFRVEGLDAAKFIAEMQFENIAGTGTFDGTLPMIFDQNGGRIEGGMMIARGEGTLSYIGEVSNENLGAMGSFAFDALKSMKYERLSIGLEGPLDGDVVTRIALKGVNQAPLGAPRTKFPIPVRIYGVNNLPFIFNITITAPFRRLFRMAQTISDPSLLIEQITPELERVGPARTLPPADKPVQPSESRP